MHEKYGISSILSVLASIKVQSNGLSQAKILQLIQDSPRQELIKIEHSSGSDMEDDVELEDVVVSGSSDPEVDLQDETQEKEAIKAGEQSSTFSIEDTSTSTDSRASDLLNETLEMEVIGDVPGESSTSTGADGPSSSPESKPSDLETSGGFTSTSTVGVSSPEESEKIDLLTELQAAALLEVLFFILIHECLSSSALQDLLIDYYITGDLLKLLSKFGVHISEDMAQLYLVEMMIVIDSVHRLGYVHRICSCFAVSLEDLLTSTAEYVW
ncbi:hypothetical protein Q8A67_021814 [Cirrhinus molitorella]|uniref:Uncharacterized protein n=1 Tax=Cirrhinus molitorella TaxID=172907 RepID=A0AA88TES9_9TELE|nr:hypothetical protein Q8A67_021814 [Cirrhinus molitorella]